MSSIIESIERRQMTRVPRFAPGDRVRVHFQVIEGERRRTQVFEGVVLKRQGNGARETFTVRKQSFGVGVERTFPVHSPKVEQLEVVARGAVRRAKLYYLRDRVGKRARVAERRWGIEDELVIADEPEPVPVDAEGETAAEAEPIEPEESTGAGDEVGEQASEPEDAGADGGEQPEAGQAEASTEPEVEGDDPAEGDNPTADSDPAEDDGPAEAEGQTDADDEGDETESGGSGR